MIQDTKRHDAYPHFSRESQEDPQRKLKREQDLGSKVLLLEKCKLCKEKKDKMNLCHRFDILDYD